MLVAVAVSSRKTGLSGSRSGQGGKLIRRAQERFPEHLGLRGASRAPRTSRRPSGLTPTATLTAIETGLPSHLCDEDPGSGRPRVPSRRSRRSTRAPIVACQDGVPIRPSPLDGPSQEGVHAFADLLAQPRDLALRHARAAHGFDEIVHRPRRDAVHAGSLDHRRERLPGSRCVGSGALRCAGRPAHPCAPRPPTPSAARPHRPGGDCVPPIATRGDRDRPMAPPGRLGGK